MHPINILRIFLCVQLKTRRTREKLADLTASSGS
jgi:hypothetical protein